MGKIRCKWMVSREAILRFMGPGGRGVGARYGGRGWPKVQPPFLSNLIPLDSLTSRMLRFLSKMFGFLPEYLCIFHSKQILPSQLKNLITGLHHIDAQIQIIILLFMADIPREI